jgi:Flp pilus assembly pilin Flp
MSYLWRAFSKLVSDDSGQGITEYGSILAFVAIIIAVIIPMQNTLRSSVSQSYSTCVNSMQTLNSVVQADLSSGS